MILCPGCNKPASAQAILCPNCGRPLRGEAQIELIDALEEQSSPPSTDKEENHIDVQDELVDLLSTPTSVRTPFAIDIQVQRSLFKSALRQYIIAIVTATGSLLGAFGFYFSAKGDFINSLIYLTIGSLGGGGIFYFVGKAVASALLQLVALIENKFPMIYLPFSADRTSVSKEKAPIDEIESGREVESIEATWLPDGALQYRLYLEQKTELLSKFAALQLRAASLRRWILDSQKDRREGCNWGVLLLGMGVFSIALSEAGNESELYVLAIMVVSFNFLRKFFVGRKMKKDETALAKIEREASELRSEMDSIDLEIEKMGPGLLDSFGEAEAIKQTRELLRRGEKVISRNSSPAEIKTTVALEPEEQLVISIAAAASGVGLLHIAKYVNGTFVDYPVVSCIFALFIMLIYIIPLLGLAWFTVSGWFTLTNALVTYVQSNQKERTAFLGRRKAKMLAALALITLSSTAFWIWTIFVSVM